LARSKGVGLAAAAAGSFAGAWLGFHATDGPLALLTAIAGALAGANLTLILIDMSRTRLIRNHSAATTTATNAPSPELETVPLTGVGWS
jgi:hypothetical protein